MESVDTASMASTAAKGSELEIGDRETRAVIERHWAASDANDFEAEHEI